jgi:hypothetical protein
MWLSAMTRLAPSPASMTPLPLPGFSLAMMIPKAGPMRRKLVRLVRADRRLTQKRAAAATMRARTVPTDQAAALLAMISRLVGLLL